MGNFIGYSFSFVVLLGVVKYVTKHMIISLDDLFEGLYVNFIPKETLVGNVLCFLGVNGILNFGYWKQF